MGSFPSKDIGSGEEAPAPVQRAVIKATLSAMLVAIGGARNEGWGPSQLASEWSESKILIDTVYERYEL